MTSVPPELKAYLATDDSVLETRWASLLAKLETQFGRQAGIEAILFLIGIQSRGRGFEPRLSKKRKEALIMEGTHCVFETLGLYKRVDKDSKGQHLWARTAIPLPRLPLSEQEKLLRVAILSYFDAVDEHPSN